MEQLLGRLAHVSIIISSKAAVLKREQGVQIKDTSARRARPSVRTLAVTVVLSYSTNQFLVLPFRLPL